MYPNQTLRAERSCEADRGLEEHHLRGESKCTAVAVPEKVKKSISMCGTAKRKGITLLLACGAARKFLVSHWETVIVGKGSKAEDRQQQWRQWILHHYMSLKTICWNNVGAVYILLLLLLLTLHCKFFV